MNIVIKKILVSAILLISGLISYILSKLFVVSRCETLTACIKENVDVLIFLFLIMLVLFATSKLEKRLSAILNLSMYIIVVLAYFYDLFNLNFKIISIVIILVLSLLSGISLRIKDEGNHDYFKE